MPTAKEAVARDFGHRQPTKGASGQAVQNFNLMFGLDPKAGLEAQALGILTPIFLS